MKILQRYLLKELMGPLVLGVIVFTFVFMIQQIFKFVDLLLNSGVPWWMATEMVGSMLPAALTLSIPVAILIAILMGMGRMSAEREILAIRMSGVNLMQVVWPIWVMSAVTAGLMVWANFNLVPYLTLKTSDLATQIQFIIINNIPANRVYEIPESGGRKTSVVFEQRDPVTDEMCKINMRSTIAPDNIDELNTEAEDLRTSLALERRKDNPDPVQVSIYAKRLEELSRQSKQQREVFISAERGVVKQSLEDRLVQVELTNGEVSVSDEKDTATLTVVGFEKLTKGFIPRFERMRTGVWRKRPAEMTVPELLEKIDELSKIPDLVSKEYDDLWPELYSRFSLPFACLAFALIAVPLGIFMKPTGKVIPFALSFALILIYYCLMQFGRTLAQGGSTLGAVAVFMPNILLGMAGVWMTWRMTRK